MVLSKSESFTRRDPYLLMNSSIFRGEGGTRQIVLQLCGIFFKAISSKLEAGEPWHAERHPSPPDVPCYPPTKLASARPAPAGCPVWPHCCLWSPPVPHLQHLLLNLFRRAQVTVGSRPSPHSLRIRSRWKELSSVCRAQNMDVSLPHKPNAGC